MIEESSSSDSDESDYFAKMQLKSFRERAGLPVLHSNEVLSLQNAPVAITPASSDLEQT